jgi:putative ABC transport system permease protein
MNDLRHTLRRLLRARAFTVTVLLTLGLGIGANASIFSAIYSLLLKPLHYSEPERLIALHLTKKDKGRLDPSLYTITDWRDQAKTLETIAGGRMRSFGLTTAGSSVSVVLAGMVTSDFTAVLGMQPALGRSFSEQEEIQNAPVAILTDSLWRRRFGFDPGILGRRLELNEEPRTIIGVLPPGFDFPLMGAIPDLLIPISHADYGRTRGPGSLQAIARLRAGVTQREAQAELQGTVERLAQTYPENSGLGAGVEPLDEALRGRNRRPLLLLAGAGLLLLLIACANVTNLLLAQFLARSREVAIQVSLGASFGNLARQFFADGMVLSAMGATAGLLFATLVQRGLPVALRYVGVRSQQPVELDLPGLLFAIFMLVMTGLLFTLVPAVLARKSGLSQLMQETTQPGSARSRLRSAMVIGQVALSMTLLLSAGLLLRSFVRVMSVDPGFRTGQVFQFGIGIPEARYNTERKIVEFHQRVLRKLQEIPGVEAASFSGRLPLTGTFGTAFEFEAAPVEKRLRPRIPVNVVSPDYFRVLSIPLRAGRSFSEYDHADAPRVALVNEAFVKAYSANANPIGRRIRTSLDNGELNPGGAVSEIAGVASDVRQQSLETAAQPQIYLCALQYGLEGGAYVFRSARGEAGLAAAAQAAVAEVDGRLQSIHVRPMSEFVQNSVSDRRTAALLLGMLAVVALGLTAVGIYGVIAFLATQRTPEMAIRLALGAQSWQVARLIVGHGLRLATIGIAAGAVGSAWAGALLRAQLFETLAFDPVTMGCAAVLMLATAAAACAAPAKRVSSTSLRRFLSR